MTTPVTTLDQRYSDPEAVAVGWDDTLHCLDLRRGQSGRGRVSAETREVAADLPAASPVPAVAAFLPQLRGVGAGVVRPLAQVGRMLVEDAGTDARYTRRAQGTRPVLRLDP
jgi:hypothetical protein